MAGPVPRNRFPGEPETVATAIDHETLGDRVISLGNARRRPSGDSITANIKQDMKAAKVITK